MVRTRVCRCFRIRRHVRGFSVRERASSGVLRYAREFAGVLRYACSFACALRYARAFADVLRYAKVFAGVLMFARAHIFKAHKSVACVLRYAQALRRHVRGFYLQLEAHFSDFHHFLFAITSMNALCSSGVLRYARELSCRCFKVRMFLQTCALRSLLQLARCA